MSRSVERLGDAVLPSVGHVRFEFIFPLPTAAGVVGLGAAVSVSTGATWAVQARVSKAGQSSPLGRTPIRIGKRRPGR